MDKVEVVDAIMFHHLKNLKEEMKVEAPKKLKKMSQKDLRKFQSYCEMTLAECRMGFRLDYYMLDCRANLKKRYKNDLVCRACVPGVEAEREAGVGAGPGVGPGQEGAGR